MEDRIALVINIYYKIRYSTEPRDQIYLKGYEFLSFAKNIDTKQKQKLTWQYLVKKRLDSTKKSCKNALKTVSKKQIQETAEPTGGLIGITITGQNYKNCSEHVYANRKKTFCAPFTICISKINDTQIYNASDLDVVIPMCNVAEYSDNYAKKYWEVQDRNNSCCW